MADLTPLTSATPEDIQATRSVMVFRLRETQPGVNQAKQHSVPNVGSGDTE